MGTFSPYLPFQNFFTDLHQVSTFPRIALGWQSAYSLQHIFHVRVCCGFALLLHANEAAGQLEERFCAAICEIRLQAEAGVDESARAVGTRRQRGRSESVHAIDPGTGATHAEFEGGCLDHNHNGNGRVEQQIAQPHQQDLLSHRPAQMREPRHGDDQA